MKIDKHILLIICVPLIGFAVFASFVRFFAEKDYIVEYEGECDPASQTCFVGCEDENCIDTYYYSIIEKHASELFEQCGENISECSDASVCLSTDSICTITYCDPANEGEVTCEELDSSSFEVSTPEDDTTTESVEGESELEQETL